LPWHSDSCQDEEKNVTPGDATLQRKSDDHQALRDSQTPPVRWCTLRDDFRNFFFSQECAGMVKMVASLAF